MSLPHECGNTSYPTSNFVTQDEGKMTGMAEGNMSPNSQVSISSSTNLSRVIVGNNGAYVQSIIFESYARNHMIYVYGRGPEGLGAGSLKLTFKLSSGETHDLSLTSSSLKCHDEKFTGTGNITSINWTSS